MAKDRYSEPDYYEKINCGMNTSYEINNPLTFHRVVPDRVAYTVMINATPFTEDVAHTFVRTTKGKDLDKLSEKEKSVYLEIFRGFFRP